MSFVEFVDAAGIDAEIPGIILLGAAEGWDECGCHISMPFDLILDDGFICLGEIIRGDQFPISISPCIDKLPGCRRSIDQNKPDSGIEILEALVPVKSAIPAFYIVFGHALRRFFMAGHLQHLDPGKDRCARPSKYHISHAHHPP